MVANCCANVKVRLHYAVRHKAAKCGKTAWQKLRHDTSICGRCVGLAAACRSMLRGLKIRSANCRSHQKKPRGIWWIRGFQNGISQFEKKITPSLPISFHNFGNLKKVCKKFFFHVDAIALAAYAKQLLPHGKAAVCCILPRGIVWTHLNSYQIIEQYCIMKVHNYKVANDSANMAATKSKSNWHYEDPQ